jgi:hypothetical protein
MLGISFMRLFSRLNNVFKDTPQRLKPYYIYLTIQLNPYFFMEVKFGALFQHKNY